MTPISSAGCGTDMSAASEEGLPSGTSDNTASAELGVQDAALSDGMGFSRRYEIYALILFMMTTTLALVDRQIMVMLAEPIKHEFGLKDWQLGGLTGTAFALFYVGLGLPVARLAERVNRPRMIGLAISIWSAFTILGGLSVGFVQLALTRMGVGLGESGASPAIHSLLASYVPRTRRAAAFSINAAGVPAGVVLGMVIGGVVGEAYGWRTAFLVAGAPGIFVAILAATTLVEPRDSQTKRSAPAPMGAILRELLAKRAFVLLTLAAGLNAFVGSANASFVASFFLRAHSRGLANLAISFGVHLGPLAFLGIALAFAGGLLAVIGTLAGGWMTDRLVRRIGLIAYPTVLTFSTLGFVPFILFSLMTPHAGLAICLSAAASFVTSLGQGGLYASIQSLARPSIRPTASALFLFLMSIISMFGPMVVGALSDVLAAAGLGSVEGLRWALASAAMTLVLPAAIYWRARHPFAAEVVG